MIANNNQKKSFFELFDDNYEEILKNDINEARAFLSEEGFNVEADSLERSKLIKKMEFKITAIHNKLKDESLIEKAFAKLKVFIDKNKELAGFELKKLLQEIAPLYQYRNLEKMDDNGIRELLLEIDLIRLLEELDKNEL
jgi:hypothetical protein